MHQRAGSIARGSRAPRARWLWNLREAEGLEAHGRSVEVRSESRYPCGREVGADAAPIIRRSKAALDKLRLDFNENPIGCSSRGAPRAGEAQQRRNFGISGAGNACAAKAAKLFRRPR